jgi:glyoxylase-like metal-dependent hydrolase (beta-lactamase superfamily II)
MIDKIKDNVFQFCFREFGSCVYLVLLKDKKVIIDTSSSDNENELIQDLSELKLKPADINAVLLTHNHWDHTGNLKLFTEAEVYDAKNIDVFQSKEFKVIKTPGHTKDSLCFLYQDILFSGDTIFHDGGRGRTDLSGGSEQEILKSIEKLKKIKYKILCPGHIN